MFLFASVLSARLKAGLAGQKGDFAEGHQLDDKVARKIPKNMIGRTLSRAQAQRLLARMK